MATKKEEVTEMIDAVELAPTTTAPPPEGTGDNAEAVAVETSTQATTEDSRTRDAVHTRETLRAAAQKRFDQVTSKRRN